MATANYPGGRSEFFEGEMKDVLGFAEKSMEQGAESVEIRAASEGQEQPRPWKPGPRAGGAPSSAPAAEQPEPVDENPQPRVVTCGRIVKVNIAKSDGRTVQQNQWRPAIVVEAWGGQNEPINAVAFLDGLNDRAYGGVQTAQIDGQPIIACTLWVTSATHGFGPNQWCWPDELDRQLARQAQDAPAVAYQADSAK